MSSTKKLKQANIAFQKKYPKRYYEVCAKLSLLADKYRDGNN